MKKMLLTVGLVSATVLSVGTVAHAADNGSGTNYEEYTSQVGIQFTDSDNPVHNGPFKGSLALTQTPGDSLFQFGTQKIYNGAHEYKSSYKDTQFFGVSDDLADPAEAKDAKVPKAHSWKATAQLSPLNFEGSTDEAKDALGADLSFKLAPIEQFTLNVVGENEDYTVPKLSEAGVLKPYSGDAVKLGGDASVVTLKAGGDAQNILDKADDAVDKDNDGVLGKGGKAYATKLSDAKLAVKSNQQIDKKYTGIVTWTLTDAFK
ncbi:WxL domain-containing protein [Vagococcus vulneris]|nr:WxL domain-containing protein [Vagococcus vulneris]